MKLYHRIKLTSNRFNHSIILERDYDIDDSMEQVITWLTEHGFNIIGRTIVSSLDVILTDTFNPLKETK